MKIVNYWRMATLIKITGFVLSNLPFRVLEAVTIILAEILFFFPNKRKRVILSNLKYAFPNWSHKKILSVGKESAVRMFEMGLFSLVYPFLSKDACRRILLLNERVENQLTELRKTKKPILLLIPHVALFECLAVSPHFKPQGNRHLGAIYRPHRNYELDQWIKHSREKSGVSVFSRETSIWDAKKFLRQKNWLGLLFDQNSGIQGYHSNFLNRFASISTMPDLFTKSAGAIPVFVLPKRIGFFATSLKLKVIHSDSSQISLKAHQILQEEIRTYDGLSEWLWSHERWKAQQKYKLHLRHRHKRGDSCNSFARTTKFWVRLPNWLGDVVMTLPLLDAIHRGRPDASITVVGKKDFESILKPLPYIEHFKPIPKGSFFKRFYDLREYSKEYPSLIINFANSLRSDLECFLIGPPRRYGLTFSGRIRPLLTHSFNYEKKRNGRPNEIHQVEMWESFLKFFGLNKELDLSPIKTSTERNPNKLGILPGSANNPAKRWPIHKWKKLVELLLNKNKSINIFIYGAFQESELANQISGDFDNSRVINLCGKTSLSELAEELASCAKVVGNDSGGMHLANAVGCPSAVLFGPTNPKVTAPCFNVPLKIIQANKTLKGKTSERLLERLSVTEVLEEINAL